MFEIEDPTDPPATFIDLDENPLRVWLRPDRVQLHVIDCRPGLAGGELRRFAAALFATYVGGELAAPLAAARAGLVAAGSGADHAAAIRDAIAAIDAVAQVLAEGAAAAVPPPPPPPRAPTPVNYFLSGRRRTQAARGRRAREPRASWPDRA